MNAESREPIDLRLTGEISQNDLILVGEIALRNNLIKDNYLERVNSFKSKEELALVYNIDYLTPYEDEDISTYIVRENNMIDYFNDNEPEVNKRKVKSAWDALDFHMTRLHNPDVIRPADCGIIPVFIKVPLLTGLRQYGEQNILLGVTPDSLSATSDGLDRLDSGSGIVIESNKKQRKIHKSYVKTLRQFSEGIKI